MKNIKIGFIGCGNIANAIIGGSVKSGYIKSEDLYVFDTDPAKIEYFRALGAAASDSAAELTSLCDYVFLTVKPQIYDIVLEQIRDAAKDVCFVAVAAGITIGHIKSVLGFDAPVIRVMPNTPLMYGQGASALVKTLPVTDEQYDYIKGFFSCCGVAVDVNESEINTVTAISGSAPAYAMRFAKGLIDFAVEQGMSEENAKALVLQTMSGSALMVKSSDKDIETLIRNVTSPNGTTEAGLRSMDATGFDASLKASLEATLKRAEELTK